MPGIAFPTVRNAGDRLVTDNTHRKSPVYRKSSSEIASDRALTSHKMQSECASGVIPIYRGSGWQRYSSKNQTAH
ncbi:unnamed protein product [Prunus armeniaca]